MKIASLYGLCIFPWEISGRHEDDQDSFSGRPQPYSGRLGHVDTEIFLACKSSKIDSFVLRMEVI